MRSATLRSTTTIRGASDRRAGVPPALAVAALLVAGCATAGDRHGDEELRALRERLDEVAQRQESLERKLDQVEARLAQAPPPPAAEARGARGARPARPASANTESSGFHVPDHLTTVRLEPQSEVEIQVRRESGPRPAPRLPTSVELKEPPTANQAGSAPGRTESVGAARDKVSLEGPAAP